MTKEVEEGVNGVSGEQRTVRERDDGQRAHTVGTRERVDQKHTRTRDLS